MPSSSNALVNMQQGSATKSTLSTSMHWERLPSLVQDAVLKELADAYNRHSLEDRRRRASHGRTSRRYRCGRRQYHTRPCGQRADKIET